MLVGGEKVEGLDGQAEDFGFCLMASRNILHS